MTFDLIPWPEDFKRAAWRLIGGNRLSIKLSWEPAESISIMKL